MNCGICFVPIPVLAVVAPACSDDSAAPSVASLDDSLLAYAACMRDTGIDMHDPDRASGMIDPGDIDAAGFDAADAACKHHLAAFGISEIESS